MPRPKKAPRWLEAARLRTGAANTDWLSRALARAGVLPLEDAELAIRAGRVRLDGREEKEPMAPVHSGSRASVDGKEVSLAWRTRVLVFHKPTGVVTHGSDAKGAGAQPSQRNAVPSSGAKRKLRRGEATQICGTVFDALRAVLPADLLGFGWHAVGRLDRDTTGLLLFTNDEKFVAHATLPETHLAKRYVARVGAKVSDAKLEPLRRGVKLEGKELARPAKAKLRGDDSVELILTEGKFHQVKRMLSAVGLPTLALHREAVGGLELDVALGEFRELSDDEVRSRLNFEPRVVGV